MTKPPLLSVVIPTYNRAHLLDRCLRSLSCCRVPAVEVVVVDDGSTDDTERVARESGVLYIRQANAGPATARNTGFAATHGRYIAFLDSDDEWIDLGATRLVEQLEANPDIGVVFADALVGNDTDGFLSFVRTYGTESFFALPHTARPGGVRVMARRALFLQVSTKNVMFLGSMVIRREALTVLGGFNPEIGTEDWDLFLRATIETVVAYSEGPALSRYYKHGAAVTANSDHMYLGYIRSLDSVRRLPALDPVERKHAEDLMRAHAFGWAWRAYHAGDMQAARERLLLSRDLGQFGSREAAYLLATYLPSPLRRSLRRARRLMGGRA